MTHLTSLINAGNTTTATLTVGSTAISANASDIVLNSDMADAGTASSTYVVCPRAGTIAKLSVVNHVANTTTATVYTAFINGGAVTHPTWQHGATDAAGTAVTVTPTAANTVAAGDVIKLTTDGGSATANQKTTFSVTITCS